MATKTRNSIIPVKEKKGKFPPNSRTTSPAKKHDQTTSNKHIPNYLKPTISSVLHLPNQQCDSPRKPNHTRRRSLDIPPPSPKHQFEKSAPTEVRQQPILTRRKSFNIPSTSTQKSQVSPSPILRSSSFSSKTILKAPRDDRKKRDLNTASGVVKRRGSEIGTPLTTKEQVSVIPLEKDEKNSHTAEVPKPEDRELSITETEKQTSNAHGDIDEKNGETQLSEDQEPMIIDQTTTEGETDMNAKIVTIGLPEQEPEHTVNEINDKIDNGIDEADPTEEVEEKVTLANKEEDMVNGNKVNETEVQDVIEQENNESENAVAAKIQEKKDSVASNSNDVIEETASKLRDQRKNKVKALAGAFETVISLQETK